MPVNKCPTFSDPALYPYIERIGECSLLIRFAEQIDSGLPSTIAAVVKYIQQHLAPKPISSVPSYTSLLLEFAPLDFHIQDITIQLQYALHVSSSEPTFERTHTAPVIEIPAYYGAEVALDAKRYQQKKDLCLSQLQQIHTSVIYQVYALGFSAGFAFMADVPKALQLPRLDSPRPSVAKGSIAIAGPQTAVYPASSPGGWNIIGRTPLSLYEPNAKSETSMTLLHPGDHVRFVAITKREYLDLGGQL
ncbi:hypothetical protein A9264_05860 [Vibrio sp. UCD-FRSSP16_10]|nr:hypothetical protein A9260_08100 [Vibrio sp. UCD-FRSSP16_30]OBT17199.1 hypothetical protein A9264_05860 [Vibrio sp. UCD-FRSSP16_10]